MRTSEDFTAQRPTGESVERTEGPSLGAWFVLAALCFVYVLNFLDRQLLSILAKPIQDELGLTDGQLGRIGGLYFALFYCVLAIPVGWLADRTNRVRILAFACALWSAATSACGFAANYSQLVVARMTVGVGEAGGVPPSYAIIYDYFPPGRRGTAIGLFNLGPPIGQALGIAFGASIAAAYSWRDAFKIIGVVGIVTALAIFLLVREPRRGRFDGEDLSPITPAAAPFLSTVRMFFARPSLRMVAFAGGTVQFVTYGVGNFTALFLMREKGMTLTDVAIWYALLVVICMSAGIALSGRLIDRLTRRNKLAHAYMPAIALICAVPFFIGFVWAPSWPLAMLFLAGPTFFNYFYLTAAVALVQEEVRPNQRVMSGALLLLVMNLIGLGLGPTYVGAVSDWLAPTHPTNALQLAFYTMIGFYGLAVLMYWRLFHILRREEAKR